MLPNGAAEEVDVENFLSKINKLLSYGGDMNFQQMRHQSWGKSDGESGSIVLLLVDTKKPYEPKGP